MKLKTGPLTIIAQGATAYVGTIITSRSSRERGIKIVTLEIADPVKLDPSLFDTAARKPVRKKRSK